MSINSAKLEQNTLCYTYAGDSEKYYREYNVNISLSLHCTVLD